MRALATIAALSAGCNAVFGLEPVSGGPDAATDAIDAPAPNAAGRVQAVSHDYQSTEGDELTYSIEAEFGPAPATCDELARFGGCISAICRTTELPERPHAGQIRFDGALSLPLTPNAAGLYPPIESQPGRLFTTPGTLRVSAPGDEVPAFDVTMVTPLSVTFTNPMPSPAGPPLIVARNADLDLAWTGGETGYVRFGLAVTGEPVVVICSFPATAGAGTVDQSLLGQLRLGPGTIGTAVTAVENLVAGAYAIQVSATVVGKRPGGDRAAGPITLE